MISIDSDVFSVEQLSSEPSPKRNNSPSILNSMELPGTHTREMPTLSSVASLEPDIVTIVDDSNDPTFPYVFWAQKSIVPPSLNDLNLPPNPFNFLTVLTVVQQNPTQQDDICSPQSPEPLESPPISTKPMNLSTIAGWELRIPQWNATFSIRKMTQDECVGLLPWMKPSIRKANPDEFICCQVQPRRHHLAR